MNQLSERELIDRAQDAHDQSAFSELVQRHQSNLRYSLRQLTGWDEALADDLAQDAFIQAYQKLSSFRGDAKFSSWLYRIGYNMFLQHCRKKQLVTEELDIQNTEHELANQTQDKPHGDLHQHLAQAMQTLSVEARSVMHLTLHQQCTQQEISDIMGIPLGSVKTHVNRSRPLLQSLLSDWQE